jgi:hydrogenase-1 operon protein HyaE
MDMPVIPLAAAEAPRPLQPPPQPPLHPLLLRLIERVPATLLAADTLDAWVVAAPGAALLVFSEDPVRFPETLDLAVIVPELASAFAGRFRVGVLPPEAARAAAGRYGFRRWPALVLLKDGQHVGAIDGLRDWADYMNLLPALLDATPSRPPGIGVAVRVAGQDPNEPHCH